MAPLIIAERRIILFLVSFNCRDYLFSSARSFRVAWQAIIIDHRRGVFCHCGVVDHVYLDLSAGAVYLTPVMTAKQLLSSQWWRCSTRLEQQKLYYFTQTINDNYLLFNNKDSIEYVSNNSGSGQLACLVPQPHQC